MLFKQTPLPGAYVLEPVRLNDERGFFARVWCSRELRDHGLCSEWVQSSVSYNKRARTLRGMHLQHSPHAEVKLVTCISGEIHDVIIDMRPESPTYRKSFGSRLSAENGLVLYVPEGFAHGFLTMTDDAMVQYHMSTYHDPSSSAGWRWDDPAFAIDWPDEPVVMSDRDRSYADFTGAL